MACDLVIVVRLELVICSRRKLTSPPPLHEWERKPTREPRAAGRLQGVNPMVMHTVSRKAHALHDVAMDEAIRPELGRVASGPFPRTLEASVDYVSPTERVEQRNEGGKRISLFITS